MLDVFARSFMHATRTQAAKAPRPVPAKPAPRLRAAAPVRDPIARRMPFSGRPTRG